MNNQTGLYSALRADGQNNRAVNASILGFNTAEELVLIEENELPAMRSAENSSNSELVNDLSIYLNQLLYSYYSSLRPSTRRPSNTTILDIHSSINDTQQIIDLNFGGSNQSTESPKKYLKITKDLLDHLCQNNQHFVDHQGIFWKDETQRNLLLQSRQLDLRNFINIKDSYQKSRKNVNTIASYSTDFFSFKSFFKHTKPYLVHFQLRNLILSIDKNAIIISDYNTSTNSFEVKRLNPENNQLDVLIDQNKLQNSFNQDIKISTLEANNDLVVAGSYTGDYLIYNNHTGSIYQDVLTTNNNGITNFIKVADKRTILFATNDLYLRKFSLKKHKLINYKFPFAINSLSIHPNNPNVRLIVGDSLNSYIFDTRFSETKPVIQFNNHYDYSFCSDWSSYDDNLIATGNQDGTVVVNDIRSIGNTNMICLASSHNNLNNNNNSIRNVRFSEKRNFLFFAETIDNINIVNLDDTSNCLSSNKNGPNYTYTSSYNYPSYDYPENIPRTLSGQCLKSFGKISGLCVNESEDNNGEVLTVGISDDSVGGILQYEYESPAKVLDFDFF